MTDQETGVPTGAPDPPTMLPVNCNTADETIYRNVRINGARDIAVLQRSPSHDGHAVIIGGGPSLNDCLDELKFRYDQRQTFFATNGTAKWLLDRGIVPQNHVLMDARPENVAFLTDGICTTYLASQCDPALFERAKNVVMYHRDCGGKSGFREHRQTAAINCGTTVGLTTLQLAYELGYRQFHLYGFDSSYRENEHHAYAQPLNDGEGVISCVISGRKFTAAAWMVRQTEEFRQIAEDFANANSIITVHGDGMLPWLARKLTEPFEYSPQRSYLTAYYDLGMSPASYDILVFLCLAEQHRKAKGLDAIRLVVVAGPAGGFRADDIQPTELSHRSQLLWNVVVQAARLLPSIKSLVWCDRHDVPEDKHKFPDGYTADYPLHAYGFSRMLEGMRRGSFASLRAPSWALRFVKKHIAPRAITLTLRETHYGTSRNSHTEEWLLAARELELCGYSPIIIRDTERAKESFEYATWPEASFDMSIRAALYESSLCNLFIANGPAGVSYLNPTCRTIMFGMIAEGHSGLTEQYWHNAGFLPGSQFPHLNCRLVWETVSAPVIVRETLDFLTQEEGNYSATG